jgi:hypothetical protein
VLIVQEAGWAQGLVWMDAENLASLGFDPQTVHLVATHYTNYVTLAHEQLMDGQKLIKPQIENNL